MRTRGAPAEKDTARAGREARAGGVNVGLLIGSGGWI